jgi:glycosyltransferase involved in cell wall biosynthesis
MSEPRILLSAYQCAPGQCPVSRIGWEWYSRLADQLPLTLVTHIRNQKWLEPNRVTGSEILYIDTEALAGPLYRTASRLCPRSQHAVFPLSSLDYFAFDRQSVRMLKARQKRGWQWDLVHCPTPVSPLAVPTLDRLGLPLVLGPWNGGLQSPKTFPEFMKQDSAWLYPIRNLGKVFEAVNGGLKHASLIFTATQATESTIAARYRDRCVRMPENGVNLRLFPPRPWPPPRSASNPLQVLFVGRLIPAKGLPMLIDAVRELVRYFPVKLTVIGDGPELANLREYATQLRLAHCINFAGALPLEKVSEAMGQSHVFCLPSVRESGCADLLEAMAAARPVIAVAYGGPAEIVDEEIGHAIAPLGREYVVQHLAMALEDIADHPDVWKQKGRRGRLRAEQQFSWEAKVRKAIEHYRRVLDGRPAATASTEPPIESEVRQLA